MELVLWSPGSSWASSTNSVAAVYASNSSRFNDRAANSIAEGKRVSAPPPARSPSAFSPRFDRSEVTITANNKSAARHASSNFSISVARARARAGGKTLALPKFLIMSLIQASRYTLI